MVPKRDKVMLAIPLDEKKLSTWPEPFIVQPKMDGFRCVSSFVDGKVKLISSYGNEVLLLPHVNEQLTIIYRRLKEKYPTAVTLPTFDGELYVHGKKFEKLASMIKRTVNIHEDFKDIEYHVFDIVDTSNTGNAIQGARLSFLLTAIATIVRKARLSVPNIKVVKSGPAWRKDIDETLADYLTNGYEGMILRHPHGTYQFKRSNYLMKIKPRREDVYKIVGIKQEVSIHGELKESLGALVLSDFSGNTFSAGTGPVLTKDGRALLWKDRDKIIGKLARVKYQNITGANGVPRSPVLFEIIGEISK